MAKDPICGMDVDEKSSLKLTSAGRDYFFCSRRCLDKFTKEENIPLENIATCSVVSSAPFYKNKTFIIGSILAGLILLSYVFKQLEPFRLSFIMYSRAIWWAVLLGFVLGGIIDFFVPREYISSILSKPDKRTIFYSVFLGFFMSACSHGILALSIQLYKKGASTSAVIAFLLASPWANIALTLMLFAFFGLKAFFMIFGAIVIAVITGLVYQSLERRGLIESNVNSLAMSADFSIKKDIKKRIKNYRFTWQGFAVAVKGIFSGATALIDMVLWWILIGIGLASLAGAYVPAHLFHSYMGPTMAGLLVTLALATVIEVCSEGSAPLAFEIFRQTGAVGNSFVFLMAGVATDYTEIGLIWHNVGKKAAIWLPIITVPQVIVLGILANILFK